MFLLYYLSVVWIASCVSYYSFARRGKLLKLKTKDASINEVKLRQALYLKRFDQQLDKHLNEPYWLQQDNIASIITSSLHFNDTKEYDLICYCIMPNHVHLVLTTFEHSLPLYAILQKHKRFTAWQSNLALKRTGHFWHHESYDHIIRDDTEMSKVIRYTINNPVSAGFVTDWQDWKWTYLKEELIPLLT